MIRRFVWMGFGAAMGATGWSYANRRVRAVVDRYAPVEVRERMANRVQAASTTVKGAFDEGRAAMAAKERELRTPKSNR